MKKFYLFLDIDGVFNSYKWVKCLSDKENANKDGFKQFDPENVKNFNLVLDALRKNDFEAKIVISSSWRLTYMMNSIPKNFKKCGLNYFGTFDKTGASGKAKSRGLEILQYVKKHAIKRNFVVIDDEIIDIVPFGIKMENIIKSSGLFDAGLTKENVMQFIQSSLPLLIEKYKQTENVIEKE